MLPDLSPYEGDDANRLAQWLEDEDGKYVADSGNEYSIRANRDADISIWGVAR